MSRFLLFLLKVFKVRDGASSKLPERPDTDKNKNWSLSNKVLDGMAKEKAVAVQILLPALLRIEREIRKDITSIAEHKWQQWWEKIPQFGISKAFFAVSIAQHRKVITLMNMKEFTTLIQAAMGHAQHSNCNKHDASRWWEKQTSPPSNPQPI